MFHKKRRYVLASSGTKGQVTVFIIVGILMLVAFAVVYFFTSSQSEDQLETEATTFVSSTPQVFEPIGLYTESCIRQVGERAVRLLGEQGGYIYPDLVGEFSLTNPTEFDGLYLESVKVPYWLYNVEPNAGSDISLASLRPGLTDEEDDRMGVEAQVRRYLSEQLEECLQDYEPFLSQGFVIIEQEQPASTVIIRDQDVVLSVEMPLRVEQGEAQADFTQFVVTLPVPLKRYYELAARITAVEQNASFLENQALGLLYSRASTDLSSLPAPSGFTFDPVSTKSWNAISVKDQYQQLLTNHVGLLRVLDTDNFYRTQIEPSQYSRQAQAVYDQMILPIPGAEGMQVTFDYGGWPLYFDVNNGAQTIKPQHLSVDYSFLHFAFQQYYTVYDVSYPVLVTLHDPEAFAGEGYTFLFAMEANVRNNLPVTHEQVLPPALGAGQQSLLCNENQFGTDLLKTVVVDSFTQEPIPLVQVGFSLPDLENCQMGATSPNGEFASKYPAAYGAHISFIKEEYLTNFYPIDTYELKDSQALIGYATYGNEGEEGVVEMHRIKRINVTVAKKNIEKCIDGTCYAGGALQPAGDGVFSYRPQLLDARHTWHFYGSVRALEQEDIAFLTLERVADLREGVQNTDFTAIVSVQGGAMQEVSLVPGVYRVSGILTSNREIFIPAEERCSEGVLESIACWDSDGCCYTLEEQRLEAFTVGQVDWNTPQTYLTITPEQLYGAQEITFFMPNINILNVPAKPHVRVLEDLQTASELGNISRMSLVRSALEPRYG